MGKIYTGLQLGVLARVTSGAYQLLSASSTRVASSFVSEAGSMLGFWATFTSVSGSPTVRFSLRSSASNGSPSTTEIAYTEQVISATGWTWIPLNASGLSVGSIYWIVAYYVSGATSATVSFNSHLQIAASSLPIGGINTFRSTDAEATWPTITSQVSFCVIKFSANHIQSIIPSYNGWASGANMRRYAGKEAGFMMVTPIGMTWNIRGLSFESRKFGTPTGAVTHKLYLNKNLVAQKVASWDASAVSTYTGNAVVLFDTPIYVPENSEIIATQTISGGDAITNYLYTSIYMTTSASFPAELLPLLRSVLPAGVSFDGTTWTNDIGFAQGGGPACGFLLDGEYPFGQPPINRRQYYNQR